jgi:hypothetical protein
MPVMPFFSSWAGVLLYMFWQLPINARCPVNVFDSEKLQVSSHNFLVLVMELLCACSW